MSLCPVCLNKPTVTKLAGPTELWRVDCCGYSALGNTEADAVELFDEHSAAVGKKRKGRK